MSSSSRLRLATQKTVEKGVYDVSDYDEIKGDKEGYK